MAWVNIKGSLALYSFSWNIVLVRNFHRQALFLFIALSICAVEPISLPIFRLMCSVVKKLCYNHVIVPVINMIMMLENDLFFSFPSFLVVFGVFMKFFQTLFVRTWNAYWIERNWRERKRQRPRSEQFLALFGFLQHFSHS